jgi:hypothetical protein
MTILRSFGFDIKTGSSWWSATSVDVICVLADKVECALIYTNNKGIILSPNMGLEVILTEFHKFWWIYISAGVYQNYTDRVSHPSLSLARFIRCPDSGACADPTTIAAACTHARTPLADCGSSHAATTAGLTSHLSLYLSSPCMATSHSYICGKWSKTKHSPRQY